MQLALNVTDFRDYSGNKHHKVDDYPYGGGAGMVLKPEPIFNAVEAITDESQERAANHSYVSARRTILRRKKRKSLHKKKNLFLFVAIMKAMMNEYENI